MNKSNTLNETVQNSPPFIEEAIKIRVTEQSFLKLFSEGKLNGTVHTSVGQEYSALSVIKACRSTDIVFSNHRCHGHYLAFTKDYKGLIAELLGKKSGVVGGIGSSQHLQNGTFFSNGIQGGIVPVAAGMAFAEKLNATNNIGIVFIGDGTLGEGVLYETMNLISKWNIPLLIVCENNGIAQTTEIEKVLAGEILDRPKAFNINIFQGSTSEVNKLFDVAKSAVSFVRNNVKPAFLLINTFRLNPHSKSDDTRSLALIQNAINRDPIHIFERENPKEAQSVFSVIQSEINEIILSAEAEEPLQIENYLKLESIAENKTIIWDDILFTNERIVKLINSFFHEIMQKDPNTLFIGEDVLSPYGGAFKVADDLSNKFPEQVITTPISEAALTGIGNGLALNGKKPYIEIMFGDFMTLTMDQLINHASKFKHMYNHKVTCPIKVRTPMGGKRAYGPTHSQTLDKYLVGIDNISVVSLNTLLNPKEVYWNVHQEPNPVIIIENKLDYARKHKKPDLKHFSISKNNEKYSVVKVSPILSPPDITIFTYGGMVEETISVLHQLVIDIDIKPELFIFTRLFPLNLSSLIESARMTKKIVTIEESSVYYGIGNEVIASLSEIIDGIKSIRIGAKPVPIPSAKPLEHSVLPSGEYIVTEIGKFINGNS